MGQASSEWWSGIRREAVVSAARQNASSWGYQKSGEGVRTDQRGPGRLALGPAGSQLAEEAVRFKQARDLGLQV